MKLFQLDLCCMNPPAAREWEGAQPRPKHTFCFLLHGSLSCSLRHGPIWESLSKWIYKCEALKRCRCCQITVNIKQCATKCSMSVEPEVQTDPHRKVLLNDHKLPFRNFYCWLWFLEGCPAPVENSKLSRTAGRAADKLPELKGRPSPPYCSTIPDNSNHSPKNLRALRTKRRYWEDQLFLLHHTTRRGRLLFFSSFLYFVRCYHTIVPLSLSGPFSPLHHLPQSVTHTDSLCNTPGSKPNSTLLDLRPFRSSKWLCSVTTLQPEWETCWRGWETGWQTQTCQGRRGNAAFIIHT